MKTFNPIERVQIEKITNVFSDLYDSFVKISKTNIDIEELKNRVTEEKILLETSLESTKYSMKILQKKHSAASNSNVYVFDYKDYEIIETTNNANIDTRLKYITGAIKSRFLFDDLKITIEPESNGFPGNTHEIERYQDKIVFRGQNNPYVNLKNMFEEQSVFEYEYYRINDAIKEFTQNMGFHYKEGQSFISKGNELLLRLRFDFPVPKTINMFSISPYILSCLGYSYCDITEISVFNKENSKYDIITPKTAVQFKHTLTYVFPSTECSYIIVELRQPKGYETRIGHFYEQFNGIRFNTEKDSLKLLGFGYNENSNELIQPNTDIQNVVLKNLYPLFNKNYPIEVLEAERFVIGISDIQVSYCSFKPTSAIISKPIPVRGLGSFRITANQNDYDIEYFLSFNNTEWVRVNKNQIYKTKDVTDQQEIKNISYKIEFNISNNNIPILYDFYLETEVAND